MSAENHESVLKEELSGMSSTSKNHPSSMNSTVRLLVLPNRNLLTDVHAQKKSCTAVKHLGSTQRIPPRFLHVKIYTCIDSDSAAMELRSLALSGRPKGGSLDCKPRLAGKQPAVNPSGRHTLGMPY